MKRCESRQVETKSAANFIFQSLQIRSRTNGSRTFAENTQTAALVFHPPLSFMRRTDALPVRPFSPHKGNTRWDSSLLCVGAVSSALTYISDCGSVKSSLSSPHQPHRTPRPTPDSHLPLCALYSGLLWCYSRSFRCLAPLLTLNWEEGSVRPSVRLSVLCQECSPLGVWGCLLVLQRARVTGRVGGGGVL